MNCVHEKKNCFVFIFLFKCKVKCPENFIWKSPKIKIYKKKENYVYTENSLSDSSVCVCVCILPTYVWDGQKRSIIIIKFHLLSSSVIKTWKLFNCNVKKFLIMSFAFGHGKSFNGMWKFYFDGILFYIFVRSYYFAIPSASVPTNRIYQ